jgi:hypothetical protein
MTPSPSGPALFEYDKERVLDAFRAGKFDAVEVVSEIVERDLFSFLRNQRLLSELAESYPTPRKKEEVPVWVYLASDVALRLHGRHSFNSFPFVVRSGGLLSLLGPEKAERRIDPTSGDLHLKCEGFNRKNHYHRETPCDADFLRKMARDTDSDELMSWFGTALPKALKKRHAFDREGIFVGDGSYLFVPDNPAYEDSTKMWFDKHNHPVDPDKTPRDERILRRCYKMVTLLHINRAQDYYFYVGARVVPGKTSEVALLYELVDDFVRAVGRGVMKLLILDRGFIDGEAIGRCKQKHRIDVLIPLKKSMDIFVDVMGLGRSEDARWQDLPAPAPPPVPPPADRPEAVTRREAKRQRTLAERRPPPPPPPRRSLLDVRALRTWQSCPVPLNVVLNREVEADGTEEFWALATTRDYVRPEGMVELYALRTTCEERHRQLKCFQELASFTSRAFSLVVNQVVFTLLTYTLLQWHLLRRERQELNRKTQPRVRETILPAAEQVVIYYENYFAFLDVYEYQELLLKLSETARVKILAKTEQLRAAMYQVPPPRRRPP